MINGFEIHVATKGDFEKIQYLFKKMFVLYSEDQNIDYPYTKKGIDYLHNCIDNGMALVARDGKEVIGFITGGVENALPFKTYQKQAYIHNLFVLEEFRRQGIGKTLIQKFIKICKDRNIDHIITDSEDSAQLRTFYQSVGFKVTGVIYEMKISSVP